MSSAALVAMAWVVGLLVRSGESDLSAGVLTGAIGIRVGLMGKYFQGDGAPLWLAILAAFVLAGTIGQVIALLT